MPYRRSQYRVLAHQSAEGKPDRRTRLVLDQMADGIAFLRICGHGPEDAARIAAEVMTRKVNEAYGKARASLPKPERNQVPAKDLTVGLLPKLEDVQAAIDVNTRERKRLFTIRRLILGNDDAAEPIRDDQPLFPAPAKPKPTIA